jgi:hypothetical protein
VLAAAALAPVPAWAGPDCPLRTTVGAISLEGRIGTTRVRAWVTAESSLGWAAGADDTPGGQYGLFYETDAWLAGNEDASVGVLRGTLTTDCRLELTETRTPSRDGKWSIAFTAPGRATGVRTSATGVTVAIEFAIATEPRCGGAGEWRQFTDASWPVTFEYPAGWRLATTPASVTLECPDLEDMASGGHQIEMSWGTGDGAPETAEDGREARVIEPFVTFADGRWQLVASSCMRAEPSDIFCRWARPFALNGMAAAYGPSVDEGRDYGPGRGYLGRGEATLFLFRWEQHWLVVRADMVNVPDPDDPNAPPVRLEGNAVDTRVLRSIRPRRP